MNLVKYANWATGASLGIGLLVVLNQLQIPFYLFYPRTTQTILISPSYDYYLFMASSISMPCSLILCRKQLPTSVLIGTLSAWAISFVVAMIFEQHVGLLYLVVVCATVLNVFRSDTRRATVREILPSALTIFALVEWSSICYFFAAAVNPHSGSGIFAQEVEASLTFFLYPVAIPIMVLLLFSWVWIPLISRLSKPKNHLLIRYQPLPRKPDFRMILAALDLLAIIAVIVFFYSYLAGQTWVVGQDTYWRYINPVNSLVGLGLPEAFDTSAKHGVYVVLLYLLQSSTGVSVVSLVKYAPLFLAFCTASVALFTTLRGGWSFRLAILSSVCILLWLPTTLGIFVDLLSNWLAFCLWMIFLALYFGADNEVRRVTYFILALLSLLILLVHPWTWGVFVTTLLFASVISRKSSWNQHTLRTLVAALVLAIPVGTAAYSFSPSLRYDLTNTIQLYVSGPFDPASLLRFGDALVNTFNNIGPPLSPAILLLCLVGAYALARRRDITASYLIAWIVVWCVGSILVAPSGFIPTNPGLNESGFWRMLYIAPLPFLLALGMEKCLTATRDSTAPSDRTSALSRIVPVLSMTPFLVAGVGLYVFWEPNVRLFFVVMSLIVALLLVVRSPNHRTLDVLILTVLVLLLFNAAFRTLFPLLVDPHNIFGSVATGPTGPPGR